MRGAALLGLGSALALAVACGGGSDTGLNGTTDGGGNAAGTGGSGNAAGTGGSGNAAATGGSGNSSGTGGATTGGAAGSDGGPTGCTSNGDCASDPNGPVCDPSTGACVGCLGASDCPQGQWCDSSTKKCASGCDEGTDCTAPTAQCDTATHTCKECLTDTNCPSGKICSGGACATGCSATQPCPNSAETCCTASCHDLQKDLTSCGTCGNACPAPANAAATCTAGTCGMGACANGFADCNESPGDGCEWNLSISNCACKPGAVEACYTGPAGTQNVGVCKAGTRTCDSSGLTWGPCFNQVVPSAEVCANNVDENCDGTVDNVPDVDGDGWTKCEGDCCETPAECSKPNKVNPGAYEVTGNSVDDDCDATTSDTTPVADCATAAKFSAVTATDVAKAMDICQFTSANPPKNQKKWGVITAAQLHADGTTPTAQGLSDMQNWQTAVLQNYGTGGVLPTKGATIAGISAGRMRDQNDPGYVNPNGGTTFTTATNPPAAYLAAHAGNLPASAGCSGTCPAGSGANDAVNIRLTIRVPTNALSFSYKFRFFSSEYWTYQCTVFNDFYLALLQTGAAGIPADKNISFDSLNNPVSVNNGFFDSCAPKTCNTCPLGMGALAGTGMQLSNTGGGTNWLTTTAPIVPGETMQIEFMVFDVSDHILDSLTLLDNFQWSLDPSGVGTSG